MPQILEMQPSESRLFSMNFSKNLAVGETITVITSVVPLPNSGATTVTINGLAIDAAGKKIQFRVEGTAGSYEVTGKVVTSDSNELEGEGILIIKDL